MQLETKKILAVFFLLLISIGLHSQFYFLEDAHDQLEIEFLKKKVEVSAKETFFNSVKIINPSNTEVEFQTNFSYPANWSYMGIQNQRIKLAPKDSIFLPFRVAPSHNVKGGIGYSIVASIADLKGEQIKNQYSFVNVPKIKDIKFKPLNRVEYVDEAKKGTEIQLMVANNGNVDEIMYLDFTFDRTIETPGTKENLFRMEVTIPSLSDTLINLPVFLTKDVDYYKRKFHRVNIKAYTADTVFKSAIWLKELSSYYENAIPDNYKFLTVEVAAQNLFSTTKPSYSLYIDGNVLFKDASEFHYMIRGYGKTFWKEPWKYGRYILSYSRGGMEIGAGDISKNMGQSLYGRGAMFDYNFKKSRYEAIATKSLFYDALNLGTSYQHSFSSLTVAGGISFVDNDSRKVESKVGFFDVAKRFGAFGNINVNMALGIADWKFDQPKTQTGVKGSVGYSNAIGKAKVNAMVMNSTPTFYGAGGIMRALGNFYMPIAGNKSVFLNYYNMQYSPVTYVRDSLVQDNYNNYSETKLYLNETLNKKLSYSIGGIFEARATNQVYSSVIQDNFSTYSSLLMSNLKFRIPSSTDVFTANFKGGYSWVSDNPPSLDTIRNNKEWFNFKFTLGYRSRIWGLSSTYFHGPNTINKQFQYFAGSKLPQSIRVMPYLDVPLMSDYLRFVSRFNFDRDITSKVTRIYWSNELASEFAKTWRVSLTNTVNYQTNIDRVTEERYKYTSTYFELRLRKDFIINQPQYRYHDLKVTFYKDLNGNKVRDEDEPGVKNVLLSIRKDENIEDEDEFNTTGYFMATDLLSDFTGSVRYDNIPGGFYLLEYFPVSKIEGAFSTDETMQLVRINENRNIEIPFTENNLIFGNIVLNRSKLSNLGSIDISNIKVTAEDSYGKKYSALTNSSGEFKIYVPNVDKYNVSVNNIFYENFALEQNNYHVQLNGYRQFEVNFIFNEKKRKINFSSSFTADIDKPGVEIVRRTNLSGIVKDATTLKPIVADVRVIDKNGRVVSTGKTSVKSGVFTLSFIAGDDYFVEVTADEYWYYAEKLNSQQVVTFKNIRKEVMLKGITVGQLIPMKTLNFDPASTEIPPTSFPELERLVKALKKNPSVKIAVHGHADDLEMKETYTDLALERSKIVARYLIANGCNRVKYLGFANKRPVADNDTNDGRRQNRRVEIVVIGK